MPRIASITIDSRQAGRPISLQTCRDGDLGVSLGNLAEIYFALQAVVDTIVVDLG